MFIKGLAVGQLGTNCFIAADDDTLDCIIIDPGDEPEMILDIVKTNNFHIIKIICTHTHFDHIGALPEIKEFSNAPIVFHKEELTIFEAAKDMAAFWGFNVGELPQPDEFIADADIIKVGNLSFTVMHTPGHSPGGICLYGHGHLFSGDTIFADSVGRTDLPGGDHNKLKNSFNRLMKLPDITKVLPGHGGPTTILRERQYNFFGKM
jgi:glyoxylase-like metal-dependent hydrolase (beta-lactamase superfamily II)